MSRLSPAAFALLEGPLDSVDKLETIRRLVRKRTLANLTSLAHELRNTEDAVHSLVGELAHAGLVEFDGVTVVLGDAAQSAEVRELLGVYDVEPTDVLGVLAMLAVDRIRSMATVAFGDAITRRRKRSGTSDD